MSGKRVDNFGSKFREKPQHAPSAAGRTPRGRGSRALRIAIITVAVLLALALAFILWWRSFAKAPDVIEAPDEQEQVGEVSDIEAPIRFGSDRKKDFYTFLVIGRDTGGGGNTDTVLLASYDVANQKMNVLSIPRDTMVNVSWDVKKINSVYNVYGGGDKGIEALDKEIAQLVGFVPDFQVVLEWKAVGELVDALGGVYYDVPRNMQYSDPLQDLYINIKKGPQTLNGSQAMQVVRFRDGPNGYANGDLGRIETQQSFLKAVVEQCLKISNVARIGELTKVFKDNVKTNMTLANMAYFGEKAVLGGLKSENVQFHTLPCQGASVWSRSYGQKLSYVVPKVDEIVTLINESFNPYKEDLKKNELDIMFVNADGTIGSSSGKVEDGKANTSVGSSNKPKEEPKQNATGGTQKPKPDTQPLPKPEVPETPEAPVTPTPEEPETPTPAPENPTPSPEPNPTPETPPVDPPVTPETPPAEDTELPAA